MGVEDKLVKISALNADLDGESFNFLVELSRS